MATAHYYIDGKEVAAGTLVLKRHMDVSSIQTWWRVARKALIRKAVPLEYESYDAADPSYIRFVCADGSIVFVDRKRSML